ncbi:hypothetical protein OAG38_02395 [Akkermansiaceae bacterium]|nr:hypothetical protein [Akkermansiaceae bacterium]
MQEEIQEPKKVKRWKVPAALVLGGGITVALVFILMQEKGGEGISEIKGNEASLDKAKLFSFIIKPIIDPIISKP